MEVCLSCVPPLLGLSDIMELLNVLNGELDATTVLDMGRGTSLATRFRTTASYKYFGAHAPDLTAWSSTKLEEEYCLLEEEYSRLTDITRSDLLVAEELRRQEEYKQRQLLEQRRLVEEERRLAEEERRLAEEERRLAEEETRLYRFKLYWVQTGTYSQMSEHHLVELLETRDRLSGKRLSEQDLLRVKYTLRLRYLQKRRQSVEKELRDLIFPFTRLVILFS